MYGIYINLGCRFEFRTQKLPYEKISDYFDDFIDFRSYGSRMQNNGIFQN